MLAGKKILVGITGSIAAYKSAILVRSLIKEGANVKVVMTTSATDFISPLTMSTLSRNPVGLDFFNEKSGEWVSHVELGLWADLFLIAPATANSIAKFANGICEDLLAAVYLSAKCPVYIAPAMDLDMYHHPSTTGNIQILRKYGNKIIEANFGELASGLIGEGRMAEPDQILQILIDHFKRQNSMQGQKALVTAGPTFEAIDPVRYIGNHSTGKMGVAIAESLAARGAHVNLVCGPGTKETSHTNVEVTRVTSAEEMYQACKQHFGTSTITVLAAAVADYKPAETYKEKLKKTDQSYVLNLTATVDIAAELGRQKKPGQMIVGFALETENEIENAREKLSRKNFDIIVLNSLKDDGAGFGYDTNKITILDTQGKVSYFDKKPKKEVAEDIVDEISTKIGI